MPIGQSFETRCSVRQEILFRRHKDRKKTQLLPMGEEENITRQKEERASHCAIFLLMYASAVELSVLQAKKRGEAEGEGKSEGRCEGP